MFWDTKIGAWNPDTAEATVFGWIAFLPDPINTLTGWELPPGSEGQNMYLVYLLVVGFEGDMKLNCR